MTQIARRPSLVANVVEILRRDLQSGIWQNHLPGEHSLCNRLQVSRPTLRQALNVLLREGLIEVSQGRRRRITSLARQRPQPKGPKIIGVLTALPYHALSTFHLFQLGKLQRCVYEAGYRFELCANPYPNSSVSDRDVDKLVSETEADHWVLLGFVGSARYWATKYRGRVLVVDARRCEPPLPCIGTDTPAAARHAVGTFLQRGHSRIALVNLRTDRPRDRLIEDAFRDGLSAAGAVQTGPVVANHNGDVERIHAALAGLVHSKSPPTGLLVTRPQHAVTALTYLTSLGVRIPEDLSLISLGYDPVLDLMTPLLSYYGTDWETFAKRLCRMVLQLAETGTLPNRRVLVMGEFRPRQTLAQRR